MAQVVADEEAVARVENASTGVVAAERRWVKHLLHELEQEVQRGSQLTQEQLANEVRWIHETATQMAHDGVLEENRHRHPDSKKLQAWLDAAKNTKTADGSDRFWAKVDPMNMLETMSCSKKDVSFEPMDMAGHPFTVEKSVAACQARCQRIPECAHFSYWEPAGHCHIQDAFAVPQPSRLLFIAGPPGCRLNEDKKQTLSVLRKKFTRCYEPNTAYGPYDLQIGAVKTKSIEKCQLLCQMTPACTHFTFWTLDGSCHLANSMDGEKRIEGVADFVAGPRTCGAGPAPAAAAALAVHMRRRFLEPPEAAARPAQGAPASFLRRAPAARVALVAVAGLAVLVGLALAALGLRRPQIWSMRSSSRPNPQTFVQLPLSPSRRPDDPRNFFL